MKKILILVLVLFPINSFTRTILVEGNYRGINGKNFKKVWKIKLESNKINFYLDGEIKARMYLENGIVKKIEEYKFFAGKKRLFTLTKPRHIKLELKSRFYPFSFVTNLMTGKPENKEKTIFRILEVIER